MTVNFAPLEIPPGIVRMATAVSRSTNWSAGNNIRWVEGKLQPIGGQSIVNYPAFASSCRLIHPWFDLQGEYHVAYVCEKNVYVDTGGVITEITPTGGMPGPQGMTGGYGDGAYDVGNYGVPPPLPVYPVRLSSMIADTYSCDNFGAVLLVQTSSDGRLLYWNPAVGGLLAQVVDTSLTPNVKAPSGRGFVVTPERFVLMYGMVDATGSGSSRRFGWSDQEDYTNWQFTNVASQAGFYDIEPASPIVTAISGKFGTLLWTSSVAYQVQFEGVPYVYGYVEAGRNCTPWSALSITVTAAQVLWYSQQGAFSFDGTNIMPVQCPIHSWINNNVDPIGVRSAGFAVHVASFNEFWWFFPQNPVMAQNPNSNPSTPVPALAAIYNYKEGWWSEANMSRTAGFGGTYSAPILMANVGVVYAHEQGVQFNAAGLPWAQTFAMNLSSGARLSTLKQMIIDLEGDPTNLSFQIYTFVGNKRENAQPLELIQFPPMFLRPDGYLDIQLTARDFLFRFEVIGPNVPLFTLGQHLVDVVQRGFR